MKAFSRFPSDNFASNSNIQEYLHLSDKWGKCYLNVRYRLLSYIYIGRDYTHPASGYCTNEVIDLL